MDVVSLLLVGGILFWFMTCMDRLSFLAFWGITLAVAIAWLAISARSFAYCAVAAILLHALLACVRDVTKIIAAWRQK